MKLRAGFLLLTMFIVMVLPADDSTLGTRARLESRGDFWVLDKGSNQGVQVGFEGYFLKKVQQQGGGGFIDDRVAHFKVTKVFQVISYALVDKWNKSYGPKDAQWAQFVANLKITRTNPTKSTSKASTTKKTVPKKPAAKRNRRWYLDKGDSAFDKGNFEQAVTFYEKVLEEDPDDPGAKLRHQQAKGRYFVNQGNLDFEREEFASAFEYYIMAYTSLGDEKLIAAEKIFGLWEQNADFLAKMTEYNIGRGEVLLVMAESVGKMLEEEQLPDASLLLQRLDRFAEDVEVKTKIDELTGALIEKETQSDLEAEDYDKVLNLIEASISADNLAKAALILKKMDSYTLPDTISSRLVTLSELLNEKLAKTELDREVENKATYIRDKEIAAEKSLLNKKFDDAIKCYLDICEIEPDEEKYREKITELQRLKFEYEKSQSELKAKVERDNHILHAVDQFESQLMQDAIDSYVKAYVVFPETGKAISGLVKVLETCQESDARYLTAELLERKLSKFSADFLGYIKTTYLQSGAETGFAILSKVTFLKENQAYQELMDSFKKDLYNNNLALGDGEFTQKRFPEARVFYQKSLKYIETAEILTKIEECDTHIRQNNYDLNLASGNEQFKAASFKEARDFYAEALANVTTPEIQRKIDVCDVILKIKPMINSPQTRNRASDYIKDDITLNRTEILAGLLNLSEKYIREGNYDGGKFLYKAVNHYKSIQSVKQRVAELKKLEKDLKKKKKVT